MKWQTNLKLSGRALYRSRARTLLSASSMTIGIASLFALFSLSAGAEKAFEEAMASMGKNLLVVGSARKNSNALRGLGQRFQTLIMDDWKAITQQIATVERAAPIAMNEFELRYRAETMNATVIGTTPEFQYSNVQHPSVGRFIDDFDLQNLSRIAVIGSQVAKELFLGEQAIGERLLIDGSPYLVIGILQEKGPDPGGSTQDDRVLVPITTAMKRLLAVDYVDRIFVQANSKETAEETMVELKKLLRKRHDLTASSPDDFKIADQAKMVQTVSRSEQTMQRFLTGLSILLLFMASIGLLAVSLLSVRERQSEIGLRLAVGARPLHVMMQFVSESVMIATLGALSGLLLAAVGITLGRYLMGWQMEITGINTLYVLLIPLLLSLLAGIYPAFEAAKLDPIDALRA